MFLGHYGAALAFKRAAPSLPLALLVVATLLLDILWIVFVLLGWERVRIVPGFTAANPFDLQYYPYSHSFAAATGWGLAAAAVYYAWPTRTRETHHRNALVLGVAVASHWLLDAIVHIPDLPLVGDQSPKIGLGLWNSLVGTVAVELLLFGGGLALFLVRRGPGTRPRTLPSVILAVLLLAAFAGALLGPPPPDFATVAASSAVATAIVLALAFWIERPRSAA